MEKRSICDQKTRRRRALVIILSLAFVGFANTRAGAAQKITAASLGVVCDGRTDNARALAAIADRTKQVSGAEVIFEGSLTPCLTSEPLTVTSNTSYGVVGGTIIFAPTENNRRTPILIRADGVSNVKVSGMTFDGRDLLDSLKRPLGIVFRSSEIKFTKVSFKNTSGIGLIFSTSVQNSGVESSSFSNIGNFWKNTGKFKDQKQGVVFCCGLRNHGNYVISSSFSNVGLDAVSFSNQDNFVARGNHFVDVGAGNNGITGLRIDAKRGMSGGASIYGAMSNGATIANNVSTGAGGNGFDLFKVSNAVITYNFAQNSGGNGISFSAGENATISNNVLENNNQARMVGPSAPQAGLFLSGGQHGNANLANVQIFDNTIRDTQRSKTQNFGIQFQVGTRTSNINIHSNSISGNAISETNDQ
jgi:hypothetical protein